MRRDARERDAGLCPSLICAQLRNVPPAKREPALFRIRSLLDLLIVGGSYALQALRQVSRLDLGMTIAAFETIPLSIFP